MAKSTPPGVPPEGGKVLPFVRRLRVPRMPPPPPVYGSHLEVDAIEAQRVFDEAAKELEEIDFDAALTDMDEAVARGEDQAEEARAAVLLMRGCRSLGRGDLALALAEVSRVIAEYPQHADAYGVRASVHVRLGDTEAALADFDRAAELAPRDPDRYLKRAGFYEHLGDRDRALANFNRAVQLDPQSAEAHAGIARCEDARGDERAAIRAYDRAIKAAPRNASLYFVRGIAHEKAGRPEQALADYTKSISLFENQSDVWMSRGRCRLKLGQTEAALADFTRVIQAAPEDGLGYRCRADALLALGRHDEALPDLDRAVALEADDSGTAHWMRGRVHDHLGDDKAALRDFDEAVRRAPGQVTFLTSRFALNCRVGHRAKSLVDIERLVELLGESAPMILTRARIRATNGKREGALADYDRVIAEEPDNAPAFHERGRTHADLGHPDEASTDLARAFELLPGDADIRCSYGENRAFRAKTAAERDAACEHIAASAELAPDESTHWYLCGEIFHRLGRHEQALACFDRSIELDPGGTYAFVRRALARYDLHELRGEPSPSEAELRAAIADYDQAIALEPTDDEELYLSRGELYDELGDVDRAIADYTKFIELAEDRIEGYAARSKARKRAGDLEGSRADAAVVAAMAAELRDEFPNISLLGALAGMSP